MPLPGEDLQHVLDHTREAWASFAGARLFITGGTGFFGKWLLESFDFINRSLALDARAVVLSRDPAGFARACPHLAQAASIELVQGNVEDFAFPAGDFSHVIHAAKPNNAAFNEGAPARMLSTIIDGTRRVLDLAQDKGAGSFLFISSGAVYGPVRSSGANPAQGSLAESCRTAPDTMDTKNAYAEGKRVAEMMCAIAAKSGLQAKIARCFSFVGPQMPLDAHFAAGNFIAQALRGEPVVIRADGQALRSYLYAADLAVALWTLLLKGESCLPYNIGSPQPVSILELARAIAAEAGPGTQVKVLGEPDTGMDCYVPDTSRFDTRFGSQVRIGFGPAIRRTYRYYRERQAA